MHARSEALTLKTIPEQMLFEIALQLHPEDLHRLAQKNKSNYNRFSSPSRHQTDVILKNLIKRSPATRSPKAILTRINYRYLHQNYLISMISILGWNHDTVLVINQAQSFDKAIKALHQILLEKKPKVDLSVSEFVAFEWMCQFVHTVALKLAIQQHQLQEQQQEEDQTGLTMTQRNILLDRRIAGVSMKVEIINVLEDYGYEFKPDASSISAAIQQDDIELVLHFISKLHNETVTTRTPKDQQSSNFFKLEELGSPPHSSLVKWPTTFGPKVIMALFERNMMSIYEPGELKQHIKSAIQHACERRRQEDGDKLEVLLDTGMVELTGLEVDELLTTSKMLPSIALILIRRGTIKSDISEWVLIQSAALPFDCFFKVLDNGGFLSRGWNVAQFLEMQCKNC
ncbi:hypothetical protein HDU76_003067 [Blyttiomyces sp. JEL0837]|nr:hypothetical protein HDU76_003067 [Blyttiomyces sp. JEL0837]